jgi:hypothetical protein
MAINPDEYLAGALAVFDSLDLENKYVRRTAVKPLYDYYQVLVLEAAVRLCGLNKTALEREHLATRWIKIKTALEVVDNPKIWDKHISHVSNVRDGVEHNDGRFPPAESLKDMRKKAPDFKNWLLSTAKKYRAESNNFSFLQEFLLKDRLVRWRSGREHF